MTNRGEDTELKDPCDTRRRPEVFQSGSANSWQRGRSQKIHGARGGEENRGDWSGRKRSIFRVLCYLRRGGCAVSQSGHIAEGGNSTGTPPRRQIRRNRTMIFLSEFLIRTLIYVHNGTGTHNKIYSASTDKRIAASLSCWNPPQDTWKPWSDVKVYRREESKSGPITYSWSLLVHCNFGKFSFCYLPRQSIIFALDLI